MTGVWRVAWCGERRFKCGAVRWTFRVAWCLGFRVEDGPSRVKRMRRMRKFTLEV